MDQKYNNAICAPGFATPPFKAFQCSVNSSLWGVYNANSSNCLCFKDRPGTIFTDKETAENLAYIWNYGKLLGYDIALDATRSKAMSVAQMDKLVFEICMYEGEYSHAIIRAAEKFHGISD